MVTADFKLGLSGQLPVVDKHWARVITSCDATKKYAFKFVGDKWIQKGTLYNLPLGTTILSYEHYFNERKVLVRVLSVTETNTSGKTLCQYLITKDNKHWVEHTSVWGDTCESLITRVLYAHWGKEEYDYNFFVNKEQREEERRAKTKPIQDYTEVSSVGARLFNFALSAPIEEAKKTKAYLQVTLDVLNKRISTA